MIMMLKTLSFLGIMCLGIMYALLTFWFFNKMDKIDKIHSELVSLRKELNEAKRK